MFSPLVALTLASIALAQTYTATYTPANAPDKSENGQSGTNKCGTGHDQNSTCQNAFVNSIDDFCVFAPPQPNSIVGETERIMVAWCTKDGHGTRLIPDGTIAGAHFVLTPDYVQVTGVGDLTKINIQADDEGGEMDPHGEDGNGNPIGGLVFSTAFTGESLQLHEWTNFMSSGIFCIRGCKDGPGAPKMCEHIYDVMGCAWNMPGDYSAGTFDTCKGDSGEPMGIYGTSTFHQSQPTNPPAHDPPPKSECSTVSSISNGVSATSTTTTSTTNIPSTTNTTSNGATPTATPGSNASSAASGESTGASEDGNGAASLSGHGFAALLAVGAVAALVA